MFNDLVNAIQNIVDPINGLMSITEYTAFGGKKYEQYIQHKIIRQLNINYECEISHLERRFDIVEREGNNFRNVCEVGHERSRQGFRALINKLFFDYIKNYQYQNFTPVSYSVLFFSIDNVNHIVSANDMMKQIQSLFGEINAPISDAKDTDGYNFGKIIVINRIENIENVRQIYDNNNWILDYIVDNEKYPKGERGRKWPKHSILRGEIDPWGNF
jgi:hypothetical protein